MDVHTKFGIFIDFFRSKGNKNNCSYRTCVECSTNDDCNGARYCSNGNCVSRSRSSTSTRNSFTARTSSSSYDDTLCNHGHSSYCSPHQAAIKSSREALAAHNAIHEAAIKRANDAHEAAFKSHLSFHNKAAGIHGIHGIHGIWYHAGIHVIY